MVALSELIYIGEKRKNGAIFEDWDHIKCEDQLTFLVILVKKFRKF